MSTNLNGYEVALDRAAWVIAEPVGPLTGSPAQPATATKVDAKAAPRNMPLRRGTQLIDIE
jgi:hypothetical protein